MSDVETERRGSVLVVSLNRPEQKNAIGGATMRLLLEAFREAANDDSIRAVVTTGRGGAYSVGADVAALKSAVGSHGPGRPDRGGSDNGLPKLSPSSSIADRLGPGRWALAMLELNKPTIAAVNGAAAGGGLCLALLHDFRIAAPTAKFVAGFGAIGLTPELGSTFLLPRLVGLPMARRMLLRNERVSAADALASGLVDAVDETGDVVEAAIAFADQMVQAPPLAIRMTAELIANGLSRSLIEQLEAEYAAQRQLFESADHREAVSAFMERRPGVFIGR
ncbi:enoyl-CoA hydratase/isomerase family protein [Nocardia vinacea]|uniref:Enoyl-CoA hydratase/isomerase family protein n=1 Tax=Nocardia vinacea TaxID=96468 RepID=A0ABZ1YTJ2_9NOCA|nr:enoyl-CoA hydratase/isomerase family protein [Nocardia vinacea]